MHLQLFAAAAALLAPSPWPRPPSDRAELDARDGFLSNLMPTATEESKTAEVTDPTAIGYKLPTQYEPTPTGAALINSKPPGSASKRSKGTGKDSDLQPVSSNPKPTAKNSKLQPVSSNPKPTAKNSKLQPVSSNPKPTAKNSKLQSVSSNPKPTGAASKKSKPHAKASKTQNGKPLAPVRVMCFEDQYTPICMPPNGYCQDGNYFIQLDVNPPHGAECFTKCAPFHVGGRDWARPF
ncbi:hypothetical protein ACCO45_002796 [Purpureocillium lilacinum]|uniref:Uncharacterized protein n=1 Tax=Purpureocillium lilacinum TaxID=33203 RepID=A0ACC4DYV8_PURLI